MFGRATVKETGKREERHSWDERLEGFWRYFEAPKRNVRGAGRSIVASRRGGRREVDHATIAILGRRGVAEPVGRPLAGCYICLTN